MTVGEMRPTGADVVADAGVVRIRRKVRTDAFDDYRWRRDPEIARYDGTVPLTMTFSEFLPLFEHDLAFPDPRKRAFSLDDPEGTHVGNIMYYNVDVAGGSAEIGVSIAAEAERGHGLGTAAVVAFLRFIWQTLPFRVVFLHTLEWNTRARSSFRRAGFDETARVSREGRWFVRMEARREWWLLHDAEGRFTEERSGGGE